jgi:hypothetical protein
MTKAKSPAPEATTENPALPLTGQPGAPDQPGADASTPAAKDPDGNPPSGETPASAEDLAAAAAEAQAKADSEANEADAAAQVAEKAEALAQAEAAEAAAASEAAEKARAEADAAAAAEAGEKTALETFADANPLPEQKLQALTYCARQIDMLNTTGHRLGLIDELTQLYRMEITEAEEGVTVACEDITSPLSDTVENALTNWANAARRTIAAAAG